MILVGKKDPIAAVPPMNGETTWLRIIYGSGADQVHIDRAVAERLRDEITQALAELDEIERAGPTKDQRERAATQIVARRSMHALPARTQQRIRNRLADLAPDLETN